jgi:hypothetical protein
MLTLEKIKCEFRNCFIDNTKDANNNHYEDANAYIMKTKSFSDSLETLLQTIEKINTKRFPDN